MPHPRQHLEPVDLGEHPVEDDQVDPGVDRQARAVLAVDRDLHLVALGAQAALEEVGDAGLVLDDKDLHGRDRTSQRRDFRRAILTPPSIRYQETTTRAQIRAKKPTTPIPAAAMIAQTAIERARGSTSMSSDRRPRGGGGDVARQLHQGCPGFR